MKGLVLTALFGLVLSSCGNPRVPPDVRGVWTGEISVEGIALPIIVRLEQIEDDLSGNIDIPSQNARRLELSDLIVRGDSVYFSLVTASGRADFLGACDNGEIAGMFVQGGFTGSFNIARTSSVAPTEEVDGEEILITGEDCLIAGTLALPEGEPRYPCVFLLTGSGPQDRDEYVMGFPVFAVLSRHLTDAGLAVLRCDDRGVGGSTGGMGSFSDSVLLYEAGLMLDFLRNDQRLDQGRIGVLGHSEGSSTAFALAASRPSDVAFVVSLAGPALDGYNTLLAQQEAILRAHGFPRDEIARKRAAQIEIMDAVISGQDEQVLEMLLEGHFREDLSRLTEEELAAMGDMDQLVSMSVRQTMPQVTSPWFRRFIVHDPAENIGFVSCPVLVLYGERDIQVLPEANLPSMEAALQGNPDHEIHVIPEANHLFQRAVTGEVEEYATLPPEFADGFPETVTEWIRERVF